MRYIPIVFLLTFFCSLNTQAHNPEASLKEIQNKPNEGQLILTQYCLNCHAKNPIIPLNAPTIGDKKAWGSRIKQGFEVLFEHTANGFNAMPARGGCFECTDEQLRMSIKALLPQKKAQAPSKDFK